MAEEVKPEEIVENWEFVGAIPTTDQVRALLNTLAPVWGIRALDYADFVVGLPSTKKAKVRDDKGRKIEEYVDVVTLYMSVAGRIRMVNDAAEKNGWAVTFWPEPNTPTGAAGYLEMDERIVYREYCEISAPDGDGGRTTMGSKPGTAWVPRTGGSAAAGSNPYEKVETAARGRAIAAWGFGVLPGSGVASLEEMKGIAENAAAMREGGGQQQQRPRLSREELLDEIRTNAETIRQKRGIEADAMNARLAKYVKESFGKDIATEGFTDDEGEEHVVALNLDGLKDGQLTLMLNQLRDTLMKLVDDASTV